jgi:hypothetical protein
MTAKTERGSPHEPSNQRPGCIPLSALGPLWISNTTTTTAGAVPMSNSQLWVCICKLLVRLRNGMADIILVMHSREVLLCDASNPFECTAEMTGRGMIGPPAEECVRLFNWVC